MVLVKGVVVVGRRVREMVWIVGVVCRRGVLESWHVLGIGLWLCGGAEAEGCIDVGLRGCKLG